MANWRIVARFGVLCVGVLLMPGAVLAQNTGIAGVVQDTSGAVMPGVTVEAESPALIEKVRTVVTDAQGLYSIVALRPGTYTVTFTLPGFSTVKREGIELSGSFTATVNVELRVGAVTETLTVSGDAPIVDTRNVVQARVMSDEVRETLPTGRNTLSMAELIPGITDTGGGGRTGHDVLGMGNNRGAAMIHGSRPDDFALQLDGAPSGGLGGGSSQTWQADPAEVQEFVFETGAISAESAAGGVRVNVIPKEGGNRFTGYAFGAFVNDDLIANNITQKLIDAGISTPNVIKLSWDLNFAAGGPIKRDRLWFFTSTRRWGRNDQLAGIFRMIDPRSFVFDPRLGAAGNADLSRPVIVTESNFSRGGRVTWQATPRNKLGFYLAETDRDFIGLQASGTVAYEAGYDQPPLGTPTIQATWKAPVSSKLLIEAMTSYNGFAVVRIPTIEGTIENQISAVRDAGTGYSYRANTSNGHDTSSWSHGSAIAAVSYVTGAHAAKFGVKSEWGHAATKDLELRPMTFTFNNGVPVQITVYNEPRNQELRFQKLGFYAQDQWTVKKRFTINGGIRFDQHIGSVPDTQTTGPNAFAPFQRWPAVKDVPNWKDLSPRFGVVYDLFGTGKTAIKYTLSRYVVSENTAGFAATQNPLLFNFSATRPWTDRNGDFIPQESELGTLSNSAFGTAKTTTVVDDAIREGWGIRQNNWETSASVQHQLLPALSVNVGFTRRWYKNFIVTDNLALAPADHDEFCITAPTNPGLGDVSGSRICGLYDLNPAKRTVTPNNLRTDAAHYGTQKESWQGIDVNFNARLSRDILVQGGVNSGTEGNSTEACFIVDSPGALRFCDISRPWRSNVKFLGSFELPWGFNAAVTFMRIPGPEILANYTVANAQITSGIVKFVNPARTSFSGGSSAVALVEPGTRFQDALTEVDVRLAKAFRYRAVRGRLSLDLGNLLNANSIQSQNNTYGTSWLRPTAILLGRVIKPGLLFEF